VEDLFLSESRIELSSITSRGDALGASGESGVGEKNAPSWRFTEADLLKEGEGGHGSSSWTSLGK